MVVDAMTGQDINKHCQRVDFDGVIVQVDGDARGGGAPFRVREVGPASLSSLFPWARNPIHLRFSIQIRRPSALGMGDVTSIVEKAQQAADEKQVDAERMLRTAYYV